MLWSEDREKKTQNWISLLSPIRAMQSNAFSKSLYERDLLSFHSIHGCSGLVLNLITRKDRVCLSSSLKQWVTDIPSVSCLNYQNLALVTSNKTLHIVYSNRWARKSGFIWFLFRRRSRFDLPFFFFFYFDHYTFPVCESLLIWLVSSSTKTDFLILRTTEPLWLLPRRRVERLPHPPMG